MDFLAAEFDEGFFCWRDCQGLLLSYCWTIIQQYERNSMVLL